MTSKEQGSATNPSENVCTLDEGPNCETSPVHDYAWFVKRVGTKLRSLAARE